MSFVLRPSRAVRLPRRRRARGRRAEDAGIASGVVDVSLRIGSAIGVALLGTIAAGRTSALQHHGVAARAAASGGFRLAFCIVTIAVAAGLALEVRYLWAIPRRASRAVEG